MLEGGPVSLRFHGYKPGNIIQVRVNGATTPVTVDREGIVSHNSTSRRIRTLAA